MPFECARCRGVVPKVILDLCPSCAGRAILDLREEVCRLQNTNNELVREQWLQVPGLRAVETLTR